MLSSQNNDRRSMIMFGIKLNPILLCAVTSIDHRAGPCIVLSGVVKMEEGPDHKRKLKLGLVKFLEFRLREEQWGIFNLFPCTTVIM